VDLVLRAMAGAGGDLFRAALPFCGYRRPSSGRESTSPEPALPDSEARPGRSRRGPHSEGPVPAPDPDLERRCVVACQILLSAIRRLSGAHAVVLSVPIRTPAPG